MSISRETQTKIVRYIGQFLVDHADELFAVEYSDLSSSDICIRLKRRNEAYESQRRKQGSIQQIRGSE